MGKPESIKSTLLFMEKKGRIAPTHVEERLKKSNWEEEGHTYVQTVRKSDVYLFILEMRYAIEVITAEIAIVIDKTNLK